MTSASSYISGLDFKTFFEKSDAMTLVLKPDAPDFTIVAATDAFLQITGFKREDIIGRKAFDVFPDNPENEESIGRKKVFQKFVEVITQKKENELPVYRYDIVDAATGNYLEKYWTNRNSPVLDDKGEVVYILNNIFDVTENEELKEHRQQAEEQLKEHQSRIRSISQRAPLGIALISADNFTMLSANPQICKILKRSYEDIIGKPFFEIMPDLTSRGYANLFERIIKTGIPFGGDELPVILTEKGGLSTRYFNLLFEPFRESNEVITGVLIFALEVTEQVLARKRTEESEQRLNLALQSAQMGVWDWDIVEDISISSARVEQIFGYLHPLPEWTFNLFIQHVDKEYQEKARAVLSNGVSSGFFQTELKICKYDKTESWVDFQGNIYRDEEGNPVRMLATLLDITNRKNLDQQKDEFIGIVSHELKTPMTSIKAYCQILQRMLTGDEDVKSAGLLCKMDMQINRLNLLIQDLLDITRIEGGRLKFRITEFSFNDMVQEVAEEMQRTTMSHHIEVTGKQDITIKADRERTGQVLTNLITNAIKYSPSKDKIVINYTEEEDRLVCSVRDFGIGIPDDKQEKVFERFFRVTGEKSETYPGLGLGLYISADIIKRQQGNIWVHSELNKGSTFYFSLPIKNSY